MPNDYPAAVTYKNSLDDFGRLNRPVSKNQVLMTASSGFHQNNVSQSNIFLRPQSSASALGLNSI